MPMNFHDPNNRTSYTTRTADASWLKLISEHVQLNGRQAVDIGCGGGIYTRALLALGAEHVTGVDFSAEMLTGARGNLADEDKVTWIQGDAYHTTLTSEQYDVALERALIHHLKDLPACFIEAHRILKPGGTLIVQDRTPEDCLLPGSSSNIRGFFFEKYPRLAEKEISRRHAAKSVTAALMDGGFHDIRELKLWETRTKYDHPEVLYEDLRQRTGRSILHECSETELEELISYISGKIKGSPSILEKDPWTIWLAKA
ncbi:methyltransferase domain-containing protein [Paenibacillus sp. HJL G12]|uniref:Methyltransferase domain-containing protein n=1 Tax=Paenibacillus dendrobii TaxID=2691084 RepID=A0A7X3IGN8_9BACL|nr:class I SAM-dependent methyltransferase [Paenibacillus dendrobii]MWV43213.1 methyltransferase domain-containing protein [Paenibacillus dendrobii]